MKYYYDTEFIEGQQSRWLGACKTQPTIDLISIGIKCVDDRTYYAVSKDFNVKEAWNRWDGEYWEQGAYEKYHQLPRRKKYWLRENVLKAIFNQFVLEAKEDDLIKELKGHHTLSAKSPSDVIFSKSNFEFLLQEYGKSRETIQTEVLNFLYSDRKTIDGGGQLLLGKFLPNDRPFIELYGYYSAYDHVVLCWLFGKMIDLPKGMPMFTVDVQQKKHELIKKLCKVNHYEYKQCEDIIKKGHGYPEQVAEHHALQDAFWIEKLDNYLDALARNMKLEL